ncbi:MAG: hypothetical protein ACP5GJ_04530, partial [Nanopusillaceae archaeon]
DIKVAIFDENGNMISPEWFGWISFYGLVKGESNYYIAWKDDKCAIFDIDGNRITEWFDLIYEYGLVKGERDYYIACNGNTCAVYYKDGQKVSDDFSEKDLRYVYSIKFNDKLGIVELYSKKLKKLRSIEFQPVSLYREEIIDYTKLLNI